MVCGNCGSAGHNRRTCRQNITGSVTTGSVITVITGSVNTGSGQNDYQRLDRGQSVRVGLRARRRWVICIKKVINFMNYAKQVFIKEQIGSRDIRIVYLSWLKVKDHKGHINDDVTTAWKESIFYIDEIISDGSHLILFNQAKNACSLFHRERNPEPIVIDNKRNVKLTNLRDENYLVYWVVGNYMIDDLDAMEEYVNYIGILPKRNTFKLKTLIGHRFYLIPHRLDTEPAHHPQSNREFLIEPYLQINIHDGTEDNIYIDEGEKLSEINQWKFNALKLDYLIKQVIKLGGKNNKNLEYILDLHEDIKLDNCSEWLKDIAGVPSTFTNIT